MKPGMEALRDELGRVAADTITYSSTFGAYRWSEQRMGNALLAPDGPLWPALRALGMIASDVIGATTADADIVFSTAVVFLEHYGITGPLADACLAAAGVES